MSATHPGTHCAEREVPDCITLPARADARDRGLPPVHIYLGTEPAQFRATRVFIWSIEQVRNPSRSYHVHVMSQLAGFDRRGWTTGFTNYRFAVPHFAGGMGRAIYCDEDQIFLTDPGLLFDLDELGRHGYLAISDTETSVMLIDCEWMARLWTLEAAQREKKKGILRRTLREPGVRGPLDPHWNARDEEYVAGRSHLLHYSTLHTQPWQPFPERFAYRANRDEKLWLDLEGSAIASGFEAFRANNPTSFFRAQLERAGDELESSGFGEPPDAVRDQVAELISDLDCESVLDLELSGAALSQVLTPRWGARWETRLGLLDLAESGCDAAGPDRSRHDGVVCSSGLDRLPPEDMPWVLEQLFQQAGRFVFAAVCEPVKPSKPARGYPPIGTVHTREWWVAHFEAAASRHPQIRWQLALGQGGEDGGEVPFMRRGGPFPSGDPHVWVLTDDRPGNGTQSLGLAEALGWPFERIDLDFGPSIYLPNPILGASADVLQPESRRRLAPPWPDLVIAAGRRTAPVVRWIAEQSRGRTRTVQLGRKGSNPAAAFDLAVSPIHAGLYPRSNRLEIAGTLTRISPAKLREARAQWDYLASNVPSPRIAVLVGGRSHQYRFTPAVARKLGEDVASLAARVGASLFVTTSRRTGKAASEALESALPPSAYFHRWAEDQKPSENPLLGFLALADVLIVTGESESMLAEACATGNSVHIYPLPVRRPGLPVRLGAALINGIVRQSQASPRNNRGTTRPQQRLELFCSRLVEGGWVRPERSLAALHQSMLERGLARMFDGTVDGVGARCGGEMKTVANRVCDLMGAPKR